MTSHFCDVIDKPSWSAATWRLVAYKADHLLFRSLLFVAFGFENLPTLHTGQSQDLKEDEEIISIRSVSAPRKLQSVFYGPGLSIHSTPTGDASECRSLATRLSPHFKQRTRTIPISGSNNVIAVICDMFFLHQNAPKFVYWPGSSRTSALYLQRSSDHVAGLEGGWRGNRMTG